MNTTTTTNMNNNNNAEVINLTTIVDNINNIIENLAKSNLTDVPQLVSQFATSVSNGLEAGKMFEYIEGHVVWCIAQEEHEYTSYLPYSDEQGTLVISPECADVLRSNPELIVPSLAYALGHQMAGDVVRGFDPRAYAVSDQLGAVIHKYMDENAKVEDLDLLAKKISMKITSIEARAYMLKYYEQRKNARA